MIAPKIVVKKAGENFSIADCADINSLVIIGNYENGAQSKGYRWNELHLDGIYRKTTQELFLPEQESIFMPSCYLIKYDAKYEDGRITVITSDEKIDEDIEYYVSFS